MRKIKNEDKTPLKTTNKKQPIDDMDKRPSKKMKVDDSEAVGELFGKPTSK